jgi:hypothetical protein
MKFRFFFSAVLVCLVLANKAISQENPTILQGAVPTAVNLVTGLVPAPGNSDLPADPDPETLNQIVAHVFAQERAAAKQLRKFTPIVETCIQTQKSDPQMGAIPKSDLYFLGQADLSNKLRVRRIEPSTKQHSIMWQFEPAGFLQIIFLDRDQFDNEHYKLTHRGREFLGDVRCNIFDVQQLPDVRGWRFVGRIWVEDQDDYIVRINGSYEPERRFSLRHLEDGFYLHFESWRLNVKPGLWLPAFVYSQQLGTSLTYPGPRYKSLTRLWGYGLSPQSHQEELGRLLVEAPGVKDQDAEHDRAPLEQQREWRQMAETMSWTFSRVTGWSRRNVRSKES